MFSIGITDHLEDSRERPTGQVLAEVAELVRLGDELGVKYAWFAEHHDYVHYGHLPSPLLFALHLAGKTRRIRLGTAIICLNLHHALDVAEQVAVADLLSEGRLCAGFGSGSTPEENRLFGLGDVSEERRHAHFEESLQTICRAWSERRVLAAANDLAERCWVAVNSVGAATIAGKFNFNVLFSHLRTPEQYRHYLAAYRAAGGRRLIAANRPVFVASDDASALALAEPAVRSLWRRFQEEGKIAAGKQEPRSMAELCGHPLNFLVGSAATVIRELNLLHQQVQFDVANIEIRWSGLPHAMVRESVGGLMRELADQRQ